MEATFEISNKIATQVEFVLWPAQETFEGRPFKFLAISETTLPKMEGTYFICIWWQ